MDDFGAAAVLWFWGFGSGCFVGLIAALALIRSNNADGVGGRDASQ